MDTLHVQGLQGETIAALATAPGPAGVCVVRVSGAAALETADRLFPSVREKPSRRAGGTFFHAAVIHPVTGEPVDDAVVLVYRAPHSYTGEDVVELQGHGGSVASRRLLEAVLAAGGRQAEPGEFTKRAFLNGRLDLTQAEAVCDLIRAKTDRAAGVARAHLDGALGREVDACYARAAALGAEVEHLLDFEEGELPQSFLERAGAAVRELCAELERLARTWKCGHLLRDGALVVISGRPNAGKSSLLNALLGRARAIVHEAPGTTRDVLEEGFDLNGVPLRLVDTAGLRECGDEVEREGIARARALMRQADVNLRVVDASVAWSADIEAELEEHRGSARLIVCLTKCDRPSAGALRLPEGVAAVRVSSVSGEGLERLKRVIAEALELEGESHGAPVVSLRQVEELRLAARCGGSAAEELAAGPERLVLAAGHLRNAAEALGRVVGRVYSDDLLDLVFSRFCVGK